MELRSRLNRVLPRSYVARWNREPNGKPIVRIIDARGMKPAQVGRFFVNGACHGDV